MLCPADETPRSPRTDGRDGSDDFSQLELVQDRGFTGGIESDHEDTWVLARVSIMRRWRRPGMFCSSSVERADHSRISFLPKRPWSRRETERPIFAAKCEVGAVGSE